jgi:hypothetical protein
MDEKAKQACAKAAEIMVDSDDANKAYDVIKDVWVTEALRGYEGPEDLSDEDGRASSNPEEDLKTLAASRKDNLTEAISEAIWRLLSARGVNDDEASAYADAVGRKLDQEWGAHVDDVGTEAYDMWADGVGARDPYRYHGVSRSDF